MIVAQEKKQAIEREQEERMSKLMFTKNIQPRLIMMNEGKSYNIKSAVITIGREVDNDIVLPY